MRYAAALASIALLAAPAFAQNDKPGARDSAAIQDCIKSSGTGGARREACIGLVSTPCLNREESKSTADMMACIAREQTVWNDILNETYRRLRGKLDDKQRIKLRDMQRAWIVSRDKTCAFYWDYFQGTMASPMSAGCENRETGRRALFLLGFLDDAESK
jgi:uncharacterized protein YecT (DUF1311 family)